MNISAISFDVDMTLINTDRVIMRSMKSVRDELLKCVPGERVHRLTVDEMWSIRDREEKGFTGNLKDYDEIRRKSFLKMLEFVGHPGPELATRLNEVYLENRFNDIGTVRGCRALARCPCPAFQTRTVVERQQLPGTVRT